MIEYFESCPECEALALDVKASDLQDDAEEIVWLDVWCKNCDAKWRDFVIKNDI